MFSFLRPGDDDERDEANDNAEYVRRVPLERSYNEDDADHPDNSEMHYEPDTDPDNDDTWEPPGWWPL